MGEDQAAMAMVKRRRAWWIVGGVIFIVMLTAGAFLVQQNSRDDRLDQELARIIDEYGFEDRFADSTQVSNPPDWRIYSYRVAKLSQSDVEKIANRIERACDGCEAVRRGASGSLDSFTIETGRGFSEAVSIRLEGSVEADFFGLEREGHPHTPFFETSLFIEKNPYRPSLWDRIKGLWPW